MYKKIVTNLLILVLIVFIIAILYEQFFYKHDIHVYSDTLENIEPHYKGVDIVYFGESSNFYQEHPDTPKKRISQYVNQLLPDYEVDHLDNAGLNASNYYYIMRHIPEETDIHTLIVTMNLRSFGYTWIYDKNFNYFSRANVLIEKRPAIINRIMVGLREYEHYSIQELEDLRNLHWKNEAMQVDTGFKFKTLYDWHHYKAYASWLNDDGSWDEPKIDLTTHYIKNFAFSIDTLTNPRIADFDAIVAFAKEKNFNLAFHILPENLEEGAMLLQETGPQFKLLVEQNVALLIERYQKGNVLVINNLNSVSEEHFRDRVFPTEHFNNYGKYLCAKVIVDSLNNWKPLFPKK